jgi:3',5'-nucleoside bisphosphate phosphatase
MNCDLHCHSTVSDGLLSPVELVRRAAANGVTRLALTDHDDTGGLEAARAAAAEVGIDFVNGVEISIEWEGTGIHIVGLGIDPASPTLVAGLGAVRGGRIDRAKRMSAELEKVGIAGAFEGANRYAENPTLISRAHFARYLVAAGICTDVHKVFESYLVPGKPGYVDHRWATLEEAVAWINAAGGIAVVAHPARYKITAGALRRFLVDFRAAGGRAIEVATASHNAEQTAHFARLAQEFGFLASRGSDFHGPEESYIDLGRVGPLPAGVTPVWSVL